MRSRLYIEQIETQIVLHKRQNANQNTTASNNEERQVPSITAIAGILSNVHDRPSSTVHPSFEPERTQTSQYP